MKRTNIDKGNEVGTLGFEQWKTNIDIITKIGQYVAFLGFQHLFYFPQVSELWRKVYATLTSNLGYFNFLECPHLSNKRIFNHLESSNNIETLLTNKLSFFNVGESLSLHLKWSSLSSSLNKFNGLVRAEFNDCDITDAILSSILTQSNRMEELKLSKCDALSGEWVSSLTKSNARARSSIIKLDVALVPPWDMHVFHMFSEWQQLLDFSFSWRYELIQCPLGDHCISLSCVLGQLINLKSLSVRFDPFTRLGLPFNTQTFKTELTVFTKNLNLTSLIIDDRASVINDEDLALFAEAYPNVTELRLKDSIVASLPVSWCGNLKTLYWSTKAKNKDPFTPLPKIKNVFLDRRAFSHIQKGDKNNQSLNLALVETMKTCQLESLTMTYFDQFPPITHPCAKPFATSLVNLSSLDFSHSSVSNAQLAMVLRCTKNLKSLSLFHCEELSGMGLLPLWEDDNNNNKNNNNNNNNNDNNNNENKLTFLNIGSTSIQLDVIKKIVERSPLIETFKFTSYFKGVSEKKDTQKHFNELCIVLSSCAYLHTLYFSENDYVNDNNLISLFTGQPPTTNSKANAKNQKKIPLARSTASPIIKLYLFNIETVSDKFLKFLSIDERTTMLRYLDLAQTWKPTTKHVVALLSHCGMLSVQMSRQSVGKKPVLSDDQNHRLLISFRDLHQF
jgi:hypothetical protein